MPPIEKHLIFRSLNQSNMKKIKHVPTVTFTVKYNGQTFYYVEHLSEKGAVVDLELLDSNHTPLDQESELFDEVFTYLEGTFFELYREANF